MKSEKLYYSNLFSKLQKTAICKSIRGVFPASLRHGLRCGLAVAIVSMVCFLGLVNLHAELCNNGEPANILLNGSFEEGMESPTDWTRFAWDEPEPSAIHTWDGTQALTGDKSVKIYAPAPNDAGWIQTVDVEPNQWYFLSGWIKTNDVAHTLEPEDAGANLSLFGTWTHSAGVFGTQDWTRNSIRFNSEGNTQITIGARLGYWAGTTTGTAWFDDLQLKPIVPMDPHPSWKILVLIYGETDFEVTDSKDIYHHYVASMTQPEMEQAALAATQFVEIDIPALTSGNMVPSVTVRFPDRALDQLSPMGQGWWPSPSDTASERDPAFDSVIVIWDTRAIDLATNEEVWIGSADGRASDMGTGQTYCTMQIAAAIDRPHRNVFKHEWGHSILFYFDAMGTAPKPTVNNHAEPTQYVNCQTGQFYVWEDETLSNPIPNSIYNNESGFTHDYYSGTTATADQPTRCLGITPDAWALGGPVSHSGNIITPVIFTVSANPNILWPPNHKMVPVALEVEAADGGDSEPVCQIISVESNEPENGLGDGDTAPDWEITGDLSVNLRAERSGTGGGRVYDIAVMCTDACGNNSIESVSVTVPHDKGKKKK